MAASPVIRNSVAVGDPNAPANVIKPNADGSVNVRSGSSAVNTVTDKSFTTNGSDNVVMAANANRTNLLIENPINLSLNAGGDSIFVNYGAAATATGDSFEVTPGGYFPMAGMPIYLGAVHVIGATGIKCPAKEFT